MFPIPMERVVDNRRVTVPTSDGPASNELLRLRLAVEASGEVVFMTDTAGTITYVNPEFTRVYGYAASEVVGRATPRILKGGAASADDYTAFWQMLHANQVVQRVFVNRTKSGRPVYMESSANPIVEDGEIVGFLAVQRDVTARKTTEDALRDSEARYRTLAEAAHDSIFIVDREGCIEYANASSARRFGLKERQMTGRRLTDVFPLATAAQMWRELSTVFETGERQYFETRFDAPSGEIWLETWCVPLRSKDGRTDAVMGVARDATERKSLERRYLQSQKMEAIGQLTSGIAHDFNNLLTAILGYSELVLDKVHEDPELTADVEEVRKAGERAGRLTKQLLAFSRIQPSSAAIVNLNDIVLDVHKMLSRILGENIQIALEAAPNLPNVTVDAGQIEQVILNLSVNARDAMPDGGKLRIATGRAQIDATFAQSHRGAVPGRYVSLSVADTGCGMTPDVLDHAFDAFFTTKAAGKGTGLGLATVFGIAQKSGGCVAIESAPGAGTTVTVYLPGTPKIPAPAE